MPLPIQRLQGRIRIPAPGRPGQVLSVLKVDFGAWAGIASGAAKVRLRVREPPTGCARLAIQPRPQMVDTWQVSDNKLTYTFRLRDGLKFHDGQRVGAADAVLSLKRWGQGNDA